LFLFSTIFITRCLIVIRTEFLNHKAHVLKHAFEGRSLSMVLQVGQTEIIIEKGDITDQKLDAIVNAANSRLVLGAGVAGAIRRKGGPRIQEECKIKYPRGTSVGSAVITTAGDLPAKYVIHTVGPRMGEGDEDAKLKNATINTLICAEENGIKTLAFPAISTGIFGFPLDRCAEIMLTSTVKFLQDEKTHLKKVVFVLYDQEAYETFKKKYDEIEV